MNENEKLPEWIYRFNNTELKGKELEKFLAMMEKDPSLRKEVRLEKELTEALTEKEIILLRKKLQKAKSFKEIEPYTYYLYFLAACAVILIIMLIQAITEFNTATRKALEPLQALNRSSWGKPSNGEMMNPDQMEIDKATIDSILAREGRGDSSIRKQIRAMMAAKYSPFPEYEGLVGEINRANDFRLLSPQMNEKFRNDEEIQFIWETSSFHPITIIITDNHGLKVKERSSIKEKSVSLGPFSSPGLYYFKIIEDDDLIYFGKLTIR